MEPQANMELLAFSVFMACIAGIATTATTATTETNTSVVTSTSPETTKDNVTLRELDFDMNGVKGKLRFYHFPTQPIITTTDHCTVTSVGEEIQAFTKSYTEEKLWEHKLAGIDIGYQETEGNYSVLKDLRLLHSTQESDFIFLPLQVSHFDTIRNFRNPNKLYEEYTETISKSVLLNVTGSCNGNGHSDRHILHDVLTVHVSFITYIHQYLLITSEVAKEQDLFDAVCLSFSPDSRKRPSVPFELKHCCEIAEVDMFQEEQSADTSLLFECHTPTGSVFVIRRWAMVIVVLLVMFIPLSVVIFPGTPVPYKPLRDTDPTAIETDVCKDRVKNQTDEDEIDREAGRPLTDQNNLIKIEKGLGINDADFSPYAFNFRNGNNVIKMENDLGPNDADKVKNDEQEEISELSEIGTDDEADLSDELPDRVFLDSDPEFHLNLHIVFSYLLLFHVDSHVLMVLRRVIIVYLVWMITGIGIFTYKTYYPLLLDEVLYNIQNHMLWHPLFDSVLQKHDLIKEYRFTVFILPGFATLLLFILLSPILLRKACICETLHCNGDLRFFGDPFPESLVKMGELRKTPKLSKSWTYEDLMFRNMAARLKNLTKPKFWKLLWERWICKGSSCRGRQLSADLGKSVSDYVFIIFWLPVSLALLVLHVVPLFSFWANYVRTQAKAAFTILQDSPVSIFKRIIHFPLFIMQLLGIFMFDLMTWNLLLVFVQFVVFLSVDILRNATTYLSKIILVLAVVIYFLRAFSDLEDGYRQLKGTTIDLCIERAEALEDNDDENSEVVVNRKPYPPLCVTSHDGELSIPRRVFYDICKVYRPYPKEVMAAFFRIFISLGLVLVIFALISKFRIFDKFSGEWDAMLTIGTVTLPSFLGLLKSSSHLDLSDRRRERKLKTWLRKITVKRNLARDAKY